MGLTGMYCEYFIGAIREGQRLSQGLFTEYLQALVIKTLILHHLHQTVLNRELLSLAPGLVKGLEQLVFLFPQLTDPLLDFQA